MPSFVNLLIRTSFDSGSPGQWMEVSSGVSKHHKVRDNNVCWSCLLVVLQNSTKTGWRYSHMPFWFQNCVQDACLIVYYNLFGGILVTWQWICRCNLSGGEVARWEISLLCSPPWNISQRRPKSQIFRLYVRCCSFHHYPRFLALVSIVTTIGLKTERLKLKVIVLWPDDVYASLRLLS